jgi:transcriptional regulator with XRE-family HTH domain
MEQVDTICSRLKWTREALGHTQADWCRLTEIGPQAWNNYERGIRRISLNHAVQLCEKIDVSLDWIYRGVTTGLPKTFAEKVRHMRTRFD